jgi:phosphatidylglycerol:prolipoprotein diacylglycerol transferase
MFPENFSWDRPIGWIAIWQGGLVFQGAIPPALAVIWFRLRRRGIAFWRSLDMAAPYAALGHAIGRIGCFLNGCCYGKRTELPWGISFPRVPFDTTLPAEGSPPYIEHCTRYGLSLTADYWSLPVHATQLYSAGMLLLLCGVLFVFRNRCRPFDGAAAILYFILYSVGRFVVEMFRGDHNPTHVLSLSDQQVMCVAGFLASIGLFLAVRSYQKRHASTASS